MPSTHARWGTIPRASALFFQKNPDSLMPAAGLPYQTKPPMGPSQMRWWRARAEAADSNPGPGDALDCCTAMPSAWPGPPRTLRPGPRGSSPGKVGKAFEVTQRLLEIVPAATIGIRPRLGVAQRSTGRVATEGRSSPASLEVPEISPPLRPLRPQGGEHLIFSGTPAGVGAVKRGDRMQGRRRRHRRSQSRR